MFMKYLIKLEDRLTGRTALVECSEKMVLEDLSVKIKVELQLPYTDYSGHCFLSHGLVYVPDDIEWGDLVTLVAGPNSRLPKSKFFRRCETNLLKYVFTVKGSVVEYKQATDYRTLRVRCTLVKKVE